MNMQFLPSGFSTRLAVTGTGTGVGKTVASAVLCRLLEAAYWKPVQSGDLETDLSEILRLCPGVMGHLSAVQLAEPASPHLAARMEGLLLDAVEIARHLPEETRLVVEGAGGLLVPLNDHEVLADLFKALGLPLVVVAASGLGTLNHTLLTLEAARRRNLSIAGVILIGEAHGENARVLRDRGEVEILFRIPELFPLDASSVAVFARSLLDGRVDPCDEETPRVSRPLPASVLEELDRRHVWHPCTQHATAPRPLPVASAHGALLRTTDGRTVVDAVSSWWTTAHGHGHPRLARTIADQALRLDHVILAGVAHEPAALLASRLVERLPGGMSRVFWSDDGSTAVEVALKALLQMAWRRGVRRPRVAALTDAYHGDTFGAMATGDRSVFTTPFDSLLFAVDRLPSPAACRDPLFDEDWPGESEFICKFDLWLEEAGRNAAAVIVEPLVQGAGGMRMWPRRLLEHLCARCAAHGVPWIADEVLTGFGRTGPDFACADVEGRPALRPSAICLSKGITGGVLPLGATAFVEPVFADFLSDDRTQTFFHGHSYTGNAIACSAGLASLEILDEPVSGSRRKRLSQHLREGLSFLAGRHSITGTRCLGGIAAFELPGAKGGYLAPRGQDLARSCLARGVLVRPLGDTVYLMPPPCIRDNELDRCFEAMDAGLRELHS